MTATLLASTATTPIWGKFADLMSKLLVQISLVLFTIGSILGGMSTSATMLIGFRVIQGIGLGGLQALVIIVIASMFSPVSAGATRADRRHHVDRHGRWPLLGGVITDTSWLGWRWTFYVCPLAIIALIVIQQTLNVPTIRKPGVSIDYLGASLIAGGVVILLTWVTLAGKSFAWASGHSYGLAALGVVLLVLAVLAEGKLLNRFLPQFLKVEDPIIPLHLFRDRTTALATLASIAVGVALFGSAVFLGQYFQLGRGYSPTIAGLLTLPMVLGSLVFATISGGLITKYGPWKIFLIAGGVLLTTGFALLATINAHTSMWLIGLYLFILGTGMGMTMQNLVLPVQNAVAAENLGVATSTVTFFRSLGGARRASRCSVRCCRRTSKTSPCPDSPHWATRWSDAGRARRHGEGHRVRQAVEGGYRGQPHRGVCGRPAERLRRRCADHLRHRRGHGRPRIGRDPSSSGGQAQDHDSAGGTAAARRRGDGRPGSRRIGRRRRGGSVAPTGRHRPVTVRPTTAPAKPMSQVDPTPCPKLCMDTPNLTAQTVIGLPIRLGFASPASRSVPPSPPSRSPASAPKACRTRSTTPWGSTPDLLADTRSPLEILSHVAELLRTRPPDRSRSRGRRPGRPAVAPQRRRGPAHRQRRHPRAAYRQRRATSMR